MDENLNPNENGAVTPGTNESFEEFLRKQEVLLPSDTDAVNDAEQKTQDEPSPAESFHDFIARQTAGDADGAEPAADEEPAESGDEQQENAPADTGKKKKRTRTVILTVVLIALVAAAGVCAYLILGGGGKGDYSAPVVTVDGEESDGYEFAASFMQYYSYYSMYGSAADTSAVKDNTVNQLAYISMAAKAAAAEGLELTDDDIAEIDTNTAAIAQQAEAQSMTAENYVRQIYGVAIPTETFRKISEKQHLAQKYINKVIDDTKAKYSSADSEQAILDEYESNKSKYDVCDVIYLYCSSPEDAVHIVDAVNGGSSLDDAIAAVAPDTQSRPLTGQNQSFIAQQISQEAADWIYKTNDDGQYANKAGSATTLSIQGGTYVIYQNGEPSKDESRTGTVSFVFIPSTVADAQARAERIRAEAGAADTAEAFETAAASAADPVLGIVYTAETAADGVDGAVTEWALSESRQKGDVAVVTGTQNVGTYVIRYNGPSENAAWYESVIGALTEADMDTWYNGFTASYKDKIVTDDEKIAKIISELTAKNNAS